MARFGRSFPTHTKRAKAGLSNVQITLAVATSTSSSVQIVKSGTIATTTTVAPAITAIKLAALQTLSVATATTDTLTTHAGKGMILSVTETPTRTLTKGVGKMVAGSTTTVPAMRKAIGINLGTVSTLTPKYVMRSRVVMNNFDGGITAPLSATVVTESPSEIVQPGLFRIDPPKGTITVQFRAFIMKIIRRVGISSR